MLDLFPHWIISSRLEKPLAELVKKVKQEQEMQFLWSGAPAIDFYGTLVKGGLWVGKGLGLLYQALPLAFISEKLGCEVLPELMSILPTHIHQTTDIGVSTTDSKSRNSE